MYKVSLMLTPSDGLLCEMECGLPAEVRIYCDGAPDHDLCTDCLVEAVAWHEAAQEAASVRGGLMDWRGSDDLRAQHIGEEYRRVARYSRYPSPVTVFGSARPTWDGPGSNEYGEAFGIGWALADHGFSVLTGGGPGVMEAANRGASAHVQAYGRDTEYVLSLGACLRGLPHEQEPNRYMDEYEVFDHFHARKTAMTRYSVGFVAMPGGYGTLDEVFEVLTLMQTGRTEPRPVVLVGRDFWYPMLEFLHHRLFVDGMISREDEGLVHVADYGEADKVAELIAAS